MRIPTPLTTLVLTAGLLVGCTVADPAAIDAGAREATGEGDAHARPAPSSTGESTAPATPTGPSETTARGTEDWRMSRPAPDGALDAFTTALSGPPGQPLELKVSTMAPSYRVEVYRLGAYDGGSSRLVHGPERVAGRVQPAAVLQPVSTRTVVAPWAVDVRIETAGWEPGFHVVKLVTSRWDTQVPYIVSSPSAAGTLALVAPVTTWQAYNQWGGYSLYHGPAGDSRSHVVSFDRPYSWSMGPANDFRTSTVPLVLRAERLGLPLSYFTNVDLHLDPGALDGARGYVSMGHDEYWTTTMRDVVGAARAAGVNLAILGANTMYWRVRLEADGGRPARRLVGYRDSASLDPVRLTDPAETTARFRDAPDPRPEHALLVMQYECYPVDTAYVVATPGWWGFEGTGVRAGDAIPGLVGPEADRVYPDRHLPRPLQILSQSPYECRGAGTVAHSVYFTVPSGAAVFNAGTLRWVCALADRCERPLGPLTSAFAGQVTDNVLRVFAAGPAGWERPARDNVDAFHLSAVNTVSAS